MSEELISRFNFERSANTHRYFRCSCDCPRRIAYELAVGGVMLTVPSGSSSTSPRPSSVMTRPRWSRSTSAGMACTPSREASSERRAASRSGTAGHGIVRAYARNELSLLKQRHTNSAKKPTRQTQQLQQTFNAQFYLKDTPKYLI